MWHVWFALLIPWATASNVTDEFCRVCLTNARDSVLVVPKIGNNASATEAFMTELNDFHNSSDGYARMKVRAEDGMDSYDPDKDTLVIVTDSQAGFIFGHLAGDPHIRHCHETSRIFMEKGRILQVTKR